jgi:hypothetical protein
VADSGLLQHSSQSRRTVLPAALLACVLAMGAPGRTGAAQPAPAPKPDPLVVGQRASETGAWWMIVQTACDPTTAQGLMATMNSALARMGANDLQPLVVERIEDPHLDEQSRLRMEAIMKRAAAARQQTEEMLEAKAALAAGRKPAGGLQKKEWAVVRPIRTAADLDVAIKEAQHSLAQFCREATGGVQATLLDPDKGLVAILR